MITLIICFPNYACHYVLCHSFSYARQNVGGEAAVRIFVASCNDVFVLLRFYIRKYYILLLI